MMFVAKIPAKMEESVKMIMEQLLASVKEISADLSATSVHVFQGYSILMKNTLFISNISVHVSIKANVSSLTQKPYVSAKKDIQEKTVSLTPAIHLPVIPENVQFLTMRHFVRVPMDLKEQIAKLRQKIPALVIRS